MTAPAYLEYASHAELRPYVHCVWAFTSPPDETPQRIAPDGRPELIVHVRKPYMERRASGDVVQPPVLFAGQITEPLTLVAQGDAAVIGVRLHAYAARAFLGVDADAATDKRLDLAALHGDAAVQLRREVRERGTPDDRIELLQDYVEARLRGARIDDDVKSAVEAMFAGGEPERPVHVAERQWQRRFKAEVGVSPRTLQTVLRFRRFLGCTAREWAAQRTGLATALTQASDGYKNDRAT